MKIPRKIATIAAAVGSLTAVVGAAGIGVEAAGAAPSAVAPAAGQASIRAAHFAPDVAGVDVYLSSFDGSNVRLWQGNVEYGGVTPYTSVPAGTYVVSMRLPGSNPTTPPMLTWPLEVKAGSAYTAAAIGSGNEVKGVVLDDNLTPPPAGHASVRFIAAASNAAKTDLVAVSGPALATGTTFGTSTGYAEVMGGTWPVRARTEGTPTLTADATVSVPAGTVTSIVLLNGPDRTIKLLSVFDAGAPAAMPVGAVDAGGGAEAPNREPVSAQVGWQEGVGAVALLLAAGALCAGVARRRRLAP